MGLVFCERAHGNEMRHDVGQFLEIAPDSIQWLGDYREALRQAKETRKPILVEFRCEA